MLISVSFLKNKIGNKATIKKINKSTADYIHVDIMDGEFVSPKNLDIKEIKELLKDCKKPLDIHLMVKDHLNYVKELEYLKPEYITIHTETENIKETIDYCKEKNIKIGLALNLESRVYKILPYLNDIDLVLIMGVEPGKGGQDFHYEIISKIKELKAIQKKYHYRINVDGGINEDTIKLVNTNMVVSGSFVCMSDNYDEQINKLKNS